MKVYELIEKLKEFSSMDNVFILEPTQMAVKKEPEHFTVINWELTIT